MVRTMSSRDAASGKGGLAKVQRSQVLHDCSWPRAQQRGVGAISAEKQSDSPLAGDTNRVVFSQYAEAYIPRLLLIDPAGRIVDQIVGFDEKRFEQFRQKLEVELAKLDHNK